MHRKSVYAFSGYNNYIHKVPRQENKYIMQIYRYQAFCLLNLSNIHAGKVQHNLKKMSVSMPLFSKHNCSSVYSQSAKIRNGNFPLKCCYIFSVNSHCAIKKGFSNFRSTNITWRCKQYSYIIWKSCLLMENLIKHWHFSNIEGPNFQHDNV
jgi:hypothetical protein